MSIAAAFRSVLARAALIAAPFAIGLTGSSATASPADSTSLWQVRGELEVPAMLADHVVGGIGFGLTAERGVWGVGAEAQLLQVVVCDNACGPAYAGGLDVSVTPGSWGEVTSHVSLLVQYYAQPGLHQYVPAIGPRIGVRSISSGTGVSLDAGISFAAADNFDPNGFAKNKALGWGIPELTLGFWF